MILLIDNYDSFTYNLVDYLYQLQADVTIFRNDEPFENIISNDYSGIILSPGPGTPDDSGNLNQLISFYKNRLPVLGICLGHQAIGTMFGARLIHASVPKHGKTSMINTSPDYIFHDLPSRFRVVRYHSLVLDNLPDSLEAIACSDEGENMAVKHTTLNIRGVQFHPEAYLTDHGLKLLNNWLSYNRIT